MKTPREILLERHRETQSKLDIIRETTVAAVCDRRSVAASNLVRRSRTAAAMILPPIWRELIAPARRIWVGLAAVWLLILAANLNFHTNAPRMIVTTPPRSADLIMALREQKQMLVELTGRPEAKAAEPPKTFVPQPRSDRRAEFFMI